MLAAGIRTIMLLRHVQYPYLRYVGCLINMRLASNRMAALRGHVANSFRVGCFGKFLPRRLTQHSFQANLSPRDLRKPCFGQATDLHLKIMYWFNLKTLAFVGKHILP